MSNSDGTFITVEGIDGCGKTFITEQIEDVFDDVIITQEPSDLWTGRQVRRGLADDVVGQQTNEFADLYLFMADRTMHLDHVVEPNLDRGYTVISDRYVDSTRAYQPVALKDRLDDPRSYIETLMEPWNVEPDLTIYLDISVEESLRRCDQSEKYEKRRFLEQVKDNYDELRREYSHRYVTVDGMQKKPAVLSDVLEIIEEKATCPSAKA